MSILDRVAPKGSEPDHLPRRAAVHRISGKGHLREQLKREAITNAGRDVEMAAEWFQLEEEASGISLRPAKRRPKVSRKRAV